MTKVAVMGAGSWGTAFSMMCVDAGCETVLWARRAEVAAEVDGAHTNADYLGDVTLPAGLHATADAEEALAGADAVALAVPSQGLPAALDAWRDIYPRHVPSVSLVKGIDVATRRRGSEVIRDALDVDPDLVLVISGPNLARECARRLPGATVAAGPAVVHARAVQAMCHTSYFRVYTNTDLIGVELGGAVKNAIALAAGMADGMGMGDNTKAMLLTRGLSEMTRLGVRLGGNPLTFAGLAGMGDLVATCMSRQSRNRGVGEALGRGRALDEVVEEMNMIAEGVKSSRAILAIAREHDVEMPLVEQVVEVVHEGRAPEDALRALMDREPRHELHGLPDAVTAVAGGS